MQLNPDRLCKCHNEPMVRYGRQHCCVVKRRQHWKTAAQRYRQTPKGQAATKRNGARRLFAGRNYHGRADTIERAEQINAYIKHLLSEYHGARKEEDARQLAEIDGGKEPESCPDRARSELRFELRITAQTASEVDSVNIGWSGSLSATGPARPL
jgi:hypothetical protein